METTVLVGCVGILSGFAAAFSLAFAVHAALRRRWSSLSAQDEERNVRSLLLWRMRNGFGFLLPICEVLMRIGKVSRACGEMAALCGERAIVTSPKALLSVALAFVFALALLSGAITGGPVGAVAVPVCAIAVVVAVAGNHADKRQEAVREAVPSALESMSACFGSGFTLLQTFNQVARDVPEPLSSTFERSAHIMEMGGSARSALAELREGSCASELAFVAVALDVQHQSGGAIRQVLDAATDTVKGELGLRRALRVQTAQAKLSARVVAIMPFILVAALSLASPDFLSPFFSGPAGYALLAIALAMQAAGIMLVRRALAVDGVS